MTGFYPEPQEHQDNEIFKPKFVFVKFNDERVENITNFNPLESLGIIFQHPYLKLNLRFVLKDIKKTTTKRSQFPLCLVWTVTVHKKQGRTEGELVVFWKGVFHAGQYYTVISRTKELSGLFMLGDVTANKVKINTKALEKIQRMKATSRFQPCQLQTIVLAVTTDIFTIHCDNIKFFSSPWKLLFQRSFSNVISHYMSGRNMVKIPICHL